MIKKQDDAFYWTTIVSLTLSEVGRKSRESWLSVAGLQTCQDASPTELRANHCRAVFRYFTFLKFSIQRKAFGYVQIALSKDYQAYESVCCKIGLKRQQEILLYLIFCLSRK